MPVDLALFRCRVTLHGVSAADAVAIRALMDGWLDVETSQAAVPLDVRPGTPVLDLLRQVRRLVAAEWEAAGATRVVCSGISELDGRITIFSGPSKSGKTTVLQEWLKAGFAYFANDHAWLFPDGYAASLPTAISLRTSLGPEWGSAPLSVDPRDGNLRRTVRPQHFATHYGVGIRCFGKLASVVKLSHEVSLGAAGAVWTVESRSSGKAW